MIKRELDLANGEETAFVEDLYIESFPLSERRPFAKMLDLYKNNNDFRIDILLEKEVCVGFITYWNLGKFDYIEHFAIATTIRNAGYGKLAMELLMTQLIKPIVLEAELPTTILSERRIGFYQRLGFKLWDNVQYQQPSYHNDGKTIPMKLMSFGDIDVEHDQSEIKNLLYAKVYNL